MNTNILLKQLVSIPSVFPNELVLSNFIFKFLRKIGFKIKIVLTGKKRPNIVATYGKSKKYLAFYGHLDTVPPEKNYPQNPYKLKVKNNIATGLGVADMKGGITAILKTAEYAAKNKLPIKIIFGVDEENISQGAHDLINSHLLKDVGFLIVAESGQVKKINQPFSVCYGRKGRILFDVNVIGKKTHAAESQNAINAVEEAARLIELIKKIKLPRDNYFGESNIVIHTIQAGTDSFSVPDSCFLQFSLLANLKINSQRFMEIFNLLLKKYHINANILIHKRLTPYAESFIVKKSDLLHLIEKEIIGPNAVKPIYTSSVADENIFANRLKIPVITFGPVGGGDHTKNEWLNLSSLEEVIDSYKKILHLYNNS